MSSDQTVNRDERTVAVENAGYKWAYHFLAYGLLLDWFYRVYVLHEKAGDLIALMLVSITIVSVNLIRRKAVEPFSARRFLINGAIIAFIISMQQLFMVLFPRP